LQKIPLSLLHKASGLFFLILSGVAAYKAYESLLAAGIIPAL